MDISQNNLISYHNYGCMHRVLTNLNNNDNLFIDNYLVLIFLINSDNY